MFKIELAGLIYIMLCIKNSHLENPNFTFKKNYSYQKLCIKQLILSVFEKKLAYLVLNAMDDITYFEDGAIKSASPVSLSLGQRRLLMLLMRISNIKLNSISKLVSSNSKNPCSRQSVHQAINSAKVEDIIKFAHSPDKLSKLIILTVERPSLESFVGYILRVMHFHAFKKLLVILEISGISMEEFFQKYLNHYDNCNRRIKNREKLLSAESTHTNHNAQQRVLINKVQAKSNLSPFCFVIIVVVTLFVDDNKLPKEKLNYCLSRFNDEGDYGIDNTILQKQSDNSKYARLLQKNKKGSLSNADQSLFSHYNGLYEKITIKQKEIKDRPELIVKNLDKIISGLGII